jgi:hypothetical protein
MQSKFNPNLRATKNLAEDRSLLQLASVHGNKSSSYTEDYPKL